MLKNSLIALLVFCLMANANAAKLYKLLGDAPKGSNKRPIEAKSYIPFKKRYHQLTDEQKSIYRLNFEGIQDNEIPPFPKKGMRDIYTPLVKGHARQGGGGFLALVATVNKKGDVEKVVVLLQPSKKLGDLAIAVLFNTKFKPAKCDGKPCEMEFPFEFELRHRFKTIDSLDKEHFGNNAKR